MNKAEEVIGISLGQWEITKPADASQYYDCDAIIEAYFKGKADGLAQQEKLSLRQFTENIDLAQKHVITVLDEVEKNNFTPQGAYLKFKSWFAFRAILVVSDEDFTKPSFLKNYDFLTDFEKQIKSEFYTLKFSFLSVQQSELDENLMSDGYIIKFSPIDEAATREA